MFIKSGGRLHYGVAIDADFVYVTAVYDHPNQAWQVLEAVTTQAKRTGRHDEQWCMNELEMVESLSNNDHWLNVSKKHIAGCDDCKSLDSQEKLT